MTPAIKAVPGPLTRIVVDNTRRKDYLSFVRYEVLFLRSFPQQALITLHLEVVPAITQLSYDIDVATKVDKV